MPEDSKPVIASETKIVHDDLLNIDRKLVAGQQIPPDLVDAYDGKTSEKAEAEALAYNDQTVDQLETEVNQRGLTVEGTGKDGNVLKSDLIEALEADDA